MLDRHAAFVHRVASLRVANLVGPLREVATRNAHVAYYLWVLVFPIVWATLMGEEQMQLAKPIAFRSPVQGVPPAASRRAAQRRAGAAGGYLALAAAAQDPVRAHQVPRQNLQRVAHRHRAPGEPRRAVPAGSAVLRRARRAVPAPGRAGRARGLVAPEMQQRGDARRVGAHAARALARGAGCVFPRHAEGQRGASHGRDQNGAVSVGNQLARIRGS